jgi:hypothetical protein
MLEAGAGGSAEQPPQLETPDEVQQVRSMLGMEMDDEAMSSAIQSPRNAEEEEIKRRLEALLSDGDDSDGSDEAGETEESDSSADSDEPEVATEAALEEQRGASEASGEADLNS